MRKETVSTAVKAPEKAEALSPAISYVPRETGAGLAVPLTGSVLALLALLYGVLLFYLHLSSPSWLADLLRGEAFPLLSLF